MRILFLHHTFPGPFRHLAARLAALPGNEVVFLSERSRRDVRIPGVRHMTVPGVPPVAAEERAERELTYGPQRSALRQRAPVPAAGRL